MMGVTERERAGKYICRAISPPPPKNLIIGEMPQGNSDTHLVFLPSSPFFSQCRRAVEWMALLISLLR